MTCYTLIYTPQELYCTFILRMSVRLKISAFAHTSPTGEEEERMLTLPTVEKATFENVLRFLRLHAHARMHDIPKVGRRHTEASTRRKEKEGGGGRKVLVM